MAVVMKILYLVNYEPTLFDNQYVVEYDPTQQGWDPEGRPMMAHLRTTPNISEAQHFPDFDAALACYHLSDGVRPDGEPNRPITAFHIEFEKIDP